MMGDITFRKKDTFTSNKNVQFRLISRKNTNNLPASAFVRFADHFDFDIVEEQVVEGTESGEQMVNKDLELVQKMLSTFT